MNILSECEHHELGCLQLALLASDALPELVAIEQRSHLTPWSEANFKSSLASSHRVVGLYHQQKLMAYAVLAIVAGEAELLLFVVDEKWQGKGVGRTFLHALFDYLEGQANALFLEVRAGNVPAIRLYESMGFNQVGERPNYYSVPWGREDALVFAIDWSFR